MDNYKLSGSKNYIEKFKSLKRSYQIALIIVIVVVIVLLINALGGSSTPFDKLKSHPSKAETIAVFGKPDSNCIDSYSNYVSYNNYSGFGIGKGRLEVNFTSYDSFSYAKWNIYDPEYSNSDLDKFVSKVTKTLNGRCGKYTQNQGAFIWHDKDGNSYALVKASHEIAVFFNNESLAKRYGK